MAIDFQFVLCAGFNKTLNPQKDASRAKVPVRRGWTSEHPPFDEVKDWLSHGGWVGAVVPDGCVVLDLDREAGIQEAERLFAEGAFGSKTPNGYHVWFRLPPGAAISAASAGMTVSGIPVTYRVAGRSQVIIPPSPGRTWIREPESLDELPLLPAHLMPAPRPARAYSLTDDDPAVLQALPGDDRGAEVLASRWVSALASAQPGARANTAFAAGVVLGGLAAAGRPVDAQIVSARSLADSHDAAGAGNARKSFENGFAAGARSPLPSRQVVGRLSGAGTGPAAATAQQTAPSPDPRVVVRTGDAEPDADAAADAIFAAFAPVIGPDGSIWQSNPPVEHESLRHAVSALFECLTWVRPDGRRTTPPRVVNAVYAKVSARIPRIPPIGWDDSGWSDGTVPGDEFASRVPSDPVGQIWTLFKDFAFTDQDAKTRIFAAVLSPFLMRVIRCPVPLFLFAARHPGAGKTLAAKLIARIACGDLAGVASWTTPDELDNAIYTAVQAQKPVLVIDNIRGRIASSVLESAATSRVVEGRAKFERFKGARNNTLFILTANEPALSRDMSRRVVWIGIDRGGAPAPPGLPDVDRIAQERRPFLVGAVRALIERWDAAGRPTFQVPGSDSFEEWSSTVCGILHVAGIVHDPASFRPIDAARVAAAADETTQEAIALVTAWAAAEEERGTVGAWREPEEVVALARDALPRRRGRPDLLARQILVAATTYERLGTWRVEAATDRRTFRVVPASAALTGGDTDDTPF